MSRRCVFSRFPAVCELRSRSLKVILCVFPNFGFPEAIFTILCILSIKLIFYARFMSHYLVTRAWLIYFRPALSCHGADYLVKSMWLIYFRSALSCHGSALSCEFRWLIYFRSELCKLSILAFRKRF